MILPPIDSHRLHGSKLYPGLDYYGSFTPSKYYTNFEGIRHSKENTYGNGYYGIGGNRRGYSTGNTYGSGYYGTGFNRRGYDIGNNYGSDYYGAGSNRRGYDIGSNRNGYYDIGSNKDIDNRENTYRNGYYGIERDYDMGNEKRDFKDIYQYDGLYPGSNRFKNPEGFSTHQLGAGFGGHYW